MRNDGGGGDLDRGVIRRMEGCAAACCRTSQGGWVINIIIAGAIPRRRYY